MDCERDRDRVLPPAGSRDAESERILREGLKVAPKNPMLHHALGLALVRLKRADAALAELEQATVLEPANARFAYVYAVALHSAGKPDLALAKLKRELAVHPDDRDILEALASYYQARGDGAEAAKYAARLRKLTDTSEGERLSTLVSCTRPPTLFTRSSTPLPSFVVIRLPILVRPVLDQGPIYIYFEIALKSLRAEAKRMRRG